MLRRKQGFHGLDGETVEWAGTGVLETQVVALDSIPQVILMVNSAQSYDLVHEELENRGLTCNNSGLICSLSWSLQSLTYLGMQQSKRILRIPIWQVVQNRYEDGLH